MKMFRKLVSVVAAATLLTSSLALTLPASAAEIGDTQEAVASEPNLQSEVKDGVILHAFNWSYNSIKDNLPAIAAAGYSTVQTSPVQQPKDYGLSTDVANQWWKLYQPVSMSIAQKSWLGTKDELKALCTEADKYGIKIIVDIVSNHMANYVDANGKEDANKLSEEVKTYLPTFYNNYSTYFHTETFDAKDDSATYVTRGHVSACPDLNTANTTVQNEVIKLLKECIDCGVDGFRFDAAKHIETDADGSVASQYWNNVLGAANSYYNGNLFNYGEILNTVGNGRSYSAYTKSMSVTDNKFGDTVLYQIAKAHSASGAISTNYVTGDATKSVLWAESHDTYMGSSGAGGISNTASVSNTDIVKAWAIVAARKGATALYFARPGSAIMGQASTDTTYKSTAVSEINKFHNAFAKVNSEKVGVSGSTAFVARGDSGIVLVNASAGTSASVSVANTGLANGSYVDTITGNTFTVSNGTVSGNIGSTGVAVVYHSTATPKALASVETGSFEGDTMTVQLSLENAVSGTYALEDSAPATFTGTPTIRIGSDYAYGETIHLNLTATDASGQTTKSTYSYTKNKGADSGVYVFVNPKGLGVSSWQTPFQFYIYDENKTTGEVYFNAPWSGKEAEYDPASGYYYVEVPTRCYYQKNGSDPILVDYDLAHSANTQVIAIGKYNSSQMQYPSKDGMKLGGVSHVFCESTRYGWTTTTLKPTPATVEATDVTKGNQQTTTTEPPTTQPATVYVPEGIYGDVDGDGIVTIDDATAIQKYLAEYTVTPFIEKAADVDADGKITIFDVTYIQKFLASFGDYKRTNEPYGGYLPVDPDDYFTVKSTSNLFPESEVTFDKYTDKLTVTYFMKSEKDMLRTDWMLTYDGTALELLDGDFTPYAPKTAINTKPGSVAYGVRGIYSDPSTLAPLSNNGNRVPFVTATFKVKKAANTTVDLHVSDLTLSKLNPGESISKSENETDIMFEDKYYNANCGYELVTSVYSGAYSASYTGDNDPKTTYDPANPPVTDPTVTEPPVTTPTTPVNPKPPVGNYYLVGYFNGADYYDHNYKFDANGNVTVTFEGDSYVIVQDDKGKTYMTDGWQGYVDSTILYDESTVANKDTLDKLYVPAGTATFTLTDNGDGTFTLSYVAGGSPVDPKPTTPSTPVNPKPPVGNYYLVGYFNGADYYDHNYKFDSNGNVTVSFEQDSYVIVQDDKGKTYMTDGWQGYVDSVILYDESTVANKDTLDKLFVPAGTATFTLTDNGDGTFTLSYVTGGSPVDPKPTTPSNPNTPSGNYYLVGNINGADYYDHTNKFDSNGNLTVTFTADSYVIVQNDSGKTYMTDGWQGYVDSVILHDVDSVSNKDTLDKLYVPAGTATFTLSDNGDGTFTLSYVTGGSPVDPKPTTPSNPNTPSGNYYLVGNINGADYYDHTNKFDANGNLTVTFTADSYVIVQDDNGKTYMTDTWQGYVNSAILYDVDTINNMTADKLYVPAGTVTFTLSANGDGSFTLSYTTGGSVDPGPGPVDPTPGGNTVTLSAAAVTTGDEVWYAWTWDTGSEGAWVYGGTGSTITFTGLKGNVVFARINPAKGQPNWDDKESVWNQTEDLVTQAGGTYTINSWGSEKMQGSWSGGGSTTDPTPNPPAGNTRTITVGVINYVINELGSSNFKIHYWGGASGTGDVDLVSTGQTESKSVGSAYWGNAAQTFSMFTADIPSDATGFKIWDSAKNRWFGDDGSTQSKAYIFNYSGDKALYE